MRKVILTLLLIHGLAAAGTELVQATGYEFRLAPRAGYSPGVGGELGFEGSHLMPISPHWQWRVGINYAVQIPSRQVSEISIGLNFNFSADIPRAFFIGAGVGYGSGHDFLVNEAFTSPYGDTPFTYFEFGKRFQLDKLGSFSYAPFVSVMNCGRERMGVVVNILNVAWNF